MTSWIEGKRILIAEDDGLIAIGIQYEVERWGATSVGPVPSIELALPLAERSKIDAAILDVSLRDGLVYPVAERLIEQSIPFIFNSGRRKLDIPSEFKHIPFFDKTVATGTLAKALMEVEAKFLADADGSGKGETSA